MIENDIIIWIAAVLSVYRVAHMISQEDGPFDVFTNTREFIIKLYRLTRQVTLPINKLEKLVNDQLDWAYRGISCDLCISFWLASIPAFLIHWTMLDPILAWLSISGACLIIHKKLYLH